MKITKRYLQRIIKEEIQSLLSERSPLAKRREKKKPAEWKKLHAACKLCALEYATNNKMNAQFATRRADADLKKAKKWGSWGFDKMLDKYKKLNAACMKKHGF